MEFARKEGLGRGNVKAFPGLLPHTCPPGSDPFPFFLTLFGVTGRFEGEAATVPENVSLSCSCRPARNPISRGM